MRYPSPIRRTRSQWKGSRRFPGVRERSRWSTNSRELGLRTSSTRYRSSLGKQLVRHQRLWHGRKNPEPSADSVLDHQGNKKFELRQLSYEFLQPNFNAECHRCNLVLSFNRNLLWGACASHCLIDLARAFVYKRTCSTFLAGIQPRKLFGNAA